MVVVGRLLPVVPPELAVVDRECEAVGRVMVVNVGILMVASAEVVVLRRLVGLVRRKLAVVK